MIEILFYLVVGGVFALLSNEILDHTLTPKDLIVGVFFYPVLITIGVGLFIGHTLWKLIGGNDADS